MITIDSETTQSCSWVISTFDLKILHPCMPVQQKILQLATSEERESLENFNEQSLKYELREVEAVMVEVSINE